MRCFLSSISLANLLKNSFIRNDNQKGGECMQLYFDLCSKCGLHKQYSPNDYGWYWIYVGDSEYIQQAPEKRFIRGKQELTKESLMKLQTITN
ncbi:hypothetical protein [Vibrio salinus]|uniref:hypothetical protein n=1 Tax=Vibrio salinus TaxID=2899784 RepID=UPI001E4A4877|nr:hypothetical protein [Vibrio salinus]MCE0495579.1 hypothetical protein [Vibrio salinus]